MQTRRYLLPLLLFGAVCLGLGNIARGSGVQAGLARRVLADQHLGHVLEMAKQLVRDDFTAGEGYREVWIRDLNTFIELALEENPRATLRRALVTFFAFQAPDGNIADGYVPASAAKDYYTYRSSPAVAGLLAHKNTAETDQESSLIQAVSKYVRATGDRTILDDRVDGRTVRRRMADALGYVLAERFDHGAGLVWGATTADWGDLQPEHPGAVDLDETTHRAIDIYDNAMFLIAVDDFVDLLGPNAPERASWIAVRDELVRNVRAHLWDEGRQQFVPHLYLAGSPFPATFDERRIYVHGGTAVAIEAGLLTPSATARALEHMRADVRATGAGSIGLTLYPPYPDGAFRSPGMGPYQYQNGGDWGWFGGRMVQQLIRQGLAADAYRELSPMVSRIERAGDFYEWWSVDNQPRGSAHFHGEAGVVGRAIELLQLWARSQTAARP